MKVVTQEQLKQMSAWLQVLAFGLPGSGKTWLCASAADHPSTAPLLYLDYKGMSESLAHKQFKPGTFIHLRIENFTDFNYVLTWLSKGPGKGTELEKICAKFGAEWPKTVAIDSVTEIHRMEVARYAGLESPAPGQVVNLQGLGRPRIQDWGSILDEFVMFGDWHYKKVGYNMIMTALQKSEYEDYVDAKGDPATRFLQSIPAMQGQAAEQLPSMALTVMHMTQEPAGAVTTQWGDAEPWYCTGRVRTKSKVFARDHTGAFPNRMANPTIPRMAALLRKRLASEERV